jgi:hypothetical protein
MLIPTVEKMVRAYLSQGTAGMEGACGLWVKVDGRNILFWIKETVWRGNRSEEV